MPREPQTKETAERANIEEGRFVGHGKESVLRLSNFKPSKIFKKGYIWN